MTKNDVGSCSRADDPMMRVRMALRRHLVIVPMVVSEVQHTISPPRARPIKVLVKARRENQKITSFQKVRVLSPVRRYATAAAC